MHWKDRQMFGGKPSGIVQMMGGGMTPYPSHTMPDGTVMRGAVHGQGYEEGGPVAPTEPSMNDRIAQIAAQQGISVPEARAQILQKTAADQGLTLPEEAIQSFAVGMINLNDALSQGVPIPAMQEGGLFGTELFEEGDNDINNALNTMTDITQPAVPDVPASNGMTIPNGEMGGGEMTMDQGSGYEEDVMRLKEDFKNEIRNYVSEAGKENLGKYLKDMNMTYSNALKALQESYKITVSNPSDELLNEEFLQEVMVMADQQGIPKMANGGIVDEITDQVALDKYKIKIPLEVWLNASTKQKNAILMNSLAKSEFEGTQGVDTYNADVQGLVQQAEDLIPEIGQAAGSKYKTKEGGTGGFIGQLMAAKAGETTAKQKLLGDQIAGLTRGRSTQGGAKYSTPAAVKTAMAGIGGKPDYSTFNNTIKAGVDSSVDDPTAYAVGTFASQGALPPKDQYPIYHENITVASTGEQVNFLQYYAKAAAKHLAEKDEKTGKSKNNQLDAQFNADVAQGWRSEYYAQKK